MAIYAAAVAAVEPARLVSGRLERHGRLLHVALGRGRVLRRRIDRLWVAGAGKAAVAMAGAVAALAPEVAGVVIAPRAGAGAGRRRIGRIAVLQGEHPLPGRGSFRATARLLAELAARPRRTTVLFLVSGGASALLEAAPPGVTRDEVTALNRHLLRCGAPIDVMNAVRKHVSAVKGGGLALAAAPREVVTLALSDVPGDALPTIGSGPTVADPTSYARALRLLQATDPGRTGVPEGVWRHLEAGARGEGPVETAKPGDPRLARALATVIGSNRTALAAAAREARRLGYAVAPARHVLHGEASRSARSLVARLAAAPRGPLCVLAGGESYVTVGGAAGRGGRCQELALAAARELAGSGWSLLCAGTDGIDGQTDAAGAFCDGTTAARGGRRAVARALRDHDSYRFFAALGDLFKPGPTGTNVMDLAITLHPGRLS